MKRNIRKKKINARKTFYIQAKRFIEQQRLQAEFERKLNEEKYAGEKQIFEH